ncbi:bifunctional diaminohydroxyphosphoribosylaminopyrimidine deaminase/5-amino-6-(5-phosphoribosylamino)uracil reductase RibD [Dysgonomonas macrotermitis]|uniref:Riboflavin biosynthesis protein RibD n=2 Tax=Dysgonomonas macrotermitis TaxID=1346286 RepID=A0A1M5CDJ9_9BACT|nr:bifunctional diaminohydroxyphosphoribosylaminopyrimidine deaminase/5-amino-6-(5-phosphoribosylamino)uracil reductase RibD [Dysgonomonas macrotermitis]SHF52781.1 diaminohydroxyphosphoribosylaminopyrimidine deaminase [Dysgonomonas macrotermitis]
MYTDEYYMQRCLQLAANGSGHVSPNPMVGAVVVHKGKIIGEGYHREYGKAHAEVNAINSVKDKSLLCESTIYVSLEPCSHYGKTPPCSQLIIDSRIPKVVIATLDPYFKVSGRGINMLKEAGIEVKTGVLEAEARNLNKGFFAAQQENRPYIYLKWAQTRDGYIDRARVEGKPKIPTPISNTYTRMLVHKMRSEVASIMVATNTAVNDNPSLTTRYWAGRNPVRLILDRSLRVPSDYQVLDDNVDTIVFCEKAPENNNRKRTSFVEIPFGKEMIPVIMRELHSRKINSVLVEGGALLLQSFIDAKAWDEAYIEVADIIFESGVKAPRIDGVLIDDKEIGCSQAIHLSNVEKYKIL